jgi:hypothetical protein
MLRVHLVAIVRGVFACEDSPDWWGILIFVVAVPDESMKRCRYVSLGGSAKSTDECQRTQQEKSLNEMRHLAYRARLVSVRLLR